MKRKSNLIASNLSSSNGLIESIINNSIDNIFPQKLQLHLKTKLYQSLDSWEGSKELKIAISEKLINRLLNEEIKQIDNDEYVEKSDINKNYSLLRKSVNNKIESVSKVLSYNSDWTIEKLDSININDLFNYHIKYKEENNIIFNNIVSHHEKIKSIDWNENINNQDRLNTYAKAAHSMGEKEWIQNATNKIRNELSNFYYNNYGIRYINKTNNLNLSDQSILQSNEQIKLFDVGSCFNPFSQYNEFVVTAIDLCPAVDTVIKCDFLDIETYDSENKDISISNDNDKYIRLFPSYHYNAVVFSLVLSYLPNPKQRLQMIINARKLLQHSVTKPSLLLIHEKDSIFHKSNYFHHFLNHWKKIICLQGFCFIKYEKIISRDHHAHFLMFSTKSIDDNTNNNDISIDYNDGLWIKQDFKINNESAIDLTRINNFFGINTNNNINI